MQEIVTKGGHRIKEHGYSSNKLWAKRERKRGEAEARQDEDSDLSKPEKIKRAKSRWGQSKRELSRLNKAIKKN